MPTIVVARTDANAANLLTSDVDERDRPFLTGGRTAEGFFRVRNGLDQAIARGLPYAPYADLLWWETARPDRDEAERFARAIHDRYPGKMLAYNGSPLSTGRRPWTTRPSPPRKNWPPWATSSSSSLWPASTP